VCAAYACDAGLAWRQGVALTGAPQVVIFLYLLDNDTSFVILASTFVGILIEFWKVHLLFARKSGILPGSS
jgi:Cleft lip and palate transmembrane protein 1 (CLPTM1)